jgi:hypothetical protein
VRWERCDWRSQPPAPPSLIHPTSSPAWQSGRDVRVPVSCANRDDCRANDRLAESNTVPAAGGFELLRSNFAHGPFGCPARLPVQNSLPSARMCGVSHSQSMQCARFSPDLSWTSMVHLPCRCDYLVGLRLFGLGRHFRLPY